MTPKDEEDGNEPALVDRAVEQAIDLRDALQHLPDLELDVLIDLILIELGRLRSDAS